MDALAAQVRAFVALHFKEGRDALNLYLALAWAEEKPSDGERWVKVAEELRACLEARR